MDVFARLLDKAVLEKGCIFYFQIEYPDTLYTIHEVSKLSVPLIPS